MQTDEHDYVYILLRFCVISKLVQVLLDIKFKDFLISINSILTAVVSLLHANKGKTSKPADDGHIKPEIVPEAHVVHFIDVDVLVKQRDHQ